MHAGRAPLTPVPAQVTYFDSLAPTYERPCFVDWRAEIEECLYGMPTARGYKLGFLETTRSWDPEGGEIPVSDDEVELLAALVRRVLPGLAAPAGSQTCPVTLAADGKFILDRRGQLVLGAGCSGQAFKFMPLLGELLADLVEERPRDPLLEQFRLDRPGLERPVSSIRDLLLHGT
jgi:glycine/D-amino acid oxidase-like deaminating enzyme